MDFTVLVSHKTCVKKLVGACDDSLKSQLLIYLASSDLHVGGYCVGKKETEETNLNLEKKKQKKPVGTTDVMGCYFSKLSFLSTWFFFCFLHCLVCSLESCLL